MSEHASSSKDIASPEHPSPYGDDEALDVPQVAEILGVSRNTVFDLIRTGQIKSFTIGRRRKVRGRAVRDFLDAAEAA